MVTSSSTAFIYFSSQKSQLLQGPFTKTNLTNSCFHLVASNNWIKTVYIFSRKKSVATNIIKAVLFREVYMIFGERSTSPFSKINYLSPSKAEVSRFATLS